MKRLFIMLLCLLTLCGCTKVPEGFVVGENSSDSTATGKYAIYNATGGTVTELYVYEVGSDKGINIAGNGLANGQSVNITKTTSPDATFILEFKADNGEEGKFETLHVEEVSINLLAVDARTGATAISFEQPK